MSFEGTVHKKKSILIKQYFFLHFNMESFKASN